MGKNIDLYSSMDEQFEKSFQYEKAGREYLIKAQNEKDKAQKVFFYMKAARCFESHHTWRLAYSSWLTCAKNLSSIIDPQNNKINISKQNQDILEIISPYGITDEKWTNPENKIYKDTTTEEINKHRLAWVYDFAGQAAARNHEHTNASTSYQKAGKAWLRCITFPDHQLIAAKFFTYAACESILGIGRKNFDSAEKRVSENIAYIVENTLNNTRFCKSLKKSGYQIEAYRKIATYFRSIQKHANEAGFSDIGDIAIKYEHVCLRKYYRAKKDYFHLIMDKILQLITGNGTNLLRLFFTVIIIACGIFPFLYYITTKLGDNNIFYSANSKIVLSLWDFLYFSIVTLTTLGYGDYHPTGICRFVAMLEACIGYVLLGIFVWLLTKRID